MNIVYTGQTHKRTGKHRVLGLKGKRIVIKTTWHTDEQLAWAELWEITKIVEERCKAYQNN